MAIPKKKSPDPVDVHVGRRVRMRRMMLEMSQTALGEAVGITFQQIQKYEKGTNRISASRLQQMSDFLQVPVPFFFDGAPHAASGSTGHREPVDGINHFMATRDGLALAKAFMRIGDIQLRRRIVNLAEEIADHRS